MIAAPRGKRRCMVAALRGDQNAHPWADFSQQPLRPGCAYGWFL